MAQWQNKVEQNRQDAQQNWLNNYNMMRMAQQTTPDTMLGLVLGSYLKNYVGRGLDKQAREGAENAGEGGSMGKATSDYLSSLGSDTIAGVMGEAPAPNSVVGGYEAMYGENPLADYTYKPNGGSAWEQQLKWAGMRI